MSEQLTIGFAHFFKTSLKADSVGGRGSGALPFSEVFFFDIGFLFSHREERGLWPVPHIRVNKFYVRTAYFFGGVIFCGEELWEKGGGVFFFFSSLSTT